MKNNIVHFIINVKKKDSVFAYRIANNVDSIINFNLKSGTYLVFYEENTKDPADNFLINILYNKKILLIRKNDAYERLIQ